MILNSDDVAMNDLRFLFRIPTREVERDIRHQIEKRDMVMRGARRYAGRKVWWKQFSDDTRRRAAAQSYGCLAFI